YFMKAYVINEAGSAEQLQLVNIDKPIISDNEILVKTVALSINPVDVKTRSGKAFYNKLKTEDPLILGWDISGTVEEIGKSVTDFKRSIQTVKNGGTIITMPSGADLDDLIAKAAKRDIKLFNQLVQSNGQDMEQIASWLESGQLKPEVSKVFDFSEMAKAHQEVETGRTRGKIVPALCIPESKFQKQNPMQQL
ncbi:GroES-like protein, partial [Ostertagia ostertagi]